MKLHLPKSLRSALLATFISAVAFSSSVSAAWVQASAKDGGKYDCYQYDAGSISAQPLTLVTGETGSVDVGEIGPNGVWLRANDSQLWASNPVEAHISSFTIHADAVLKISGQWSNSAAGFRNLVIDELIYSNGGQLEIGTKYNGGGYPVQNVLIKDVSGSLGAVTINENNVLTLASAELAGSITNNGVLNIAGTLTGSGEIKGEGVVQIDTFAGGSFNGMAYTYADGSAATSDACFVKGVQTFQVLGEGLSYAGDVYINGSQTPTTIGENGYVTVDFGDSNVFYVNDEWSYDAAQSSGATSFEVGKNGTLKFVGGSTASGGLVINSAGAVTMSAQTSMTDTVTISGGTFDNKSYKIEGGKLVLNGLSSATISGDRNLSLNLELVNTYLRIGTGDTFDYSDGGDLTYKIGSGATLDVQDYRQSVSSNHIIEMAGGTLTGAGATNGNYVYGIDFYNGGRFNTSADSLIATNVGGHDGGTVQFDVNPGKTLTMTGNLVGVGSFSKTADGTMVYKGAAFTQALTIGGGVFEYYVNTDAENRVETRNHNGTISGSATLRKSGAGTLNLSSSTVSVTKFDVTGGTLGYDLVSGEKSITLTGTGGTFVKSGAGTVNLGALVVLSEQDKVVTSYNYDGVLRVTEGKVVFTSLNAEQAAAPPAFVKLVNNLTTEGDGLVEIVGDVKFNYDGDNTPAANCVITLDDNLHIAGNLEINSWGSGNAPDRDGMRRWNVNHGGNIAVDGHLWLTNKQKMVINGGHVSAASGVKLGHDLNGTGQYSNHSIYSKLVMEDGSLTTTGLTYYGGNNEFLMSGGELTFSPATDGALVTNDVGTETHKNKFTVTAGVLKATDSSWALTGSSTNIVSLGNVTFDVASGKTVTLSGNIALTGSVESYGKGELQLGNTTFSIAEQDLNSFTVCRGEVADSAQENGLGGRVYSVLWGTGSIAQLDGTNLSVLIGGAAAGDRWNADTFEITSSATNDFIINTTFETSKATAANGAVGADSFIVNKGGTFTVAGDITDGKTAKELVMETLGSGTMSLTTDVSLSHSGDATKFHGNLDVESDVTLTLGRVYDTGLDSTSSNTVEYDVDVSSLAALNLKGGTLKMYYVAPHIKSMSVNKVSSIVIDDTWKDCLFNKLDATRIDNLTLNDVLNLTTGWKSNVNIGALAGRGDLIASQNNSESNYSQLWIDSVAGYTGNISIKGKMNLTLNVGENETFKSSQLTINGGDASAVLTGSGTYVLEGTSTLKVSGVTDSDNWTGTVKITNTHIGAFNPASYGNANSAVELCGVTTWMAENSQMASLLKLTKDGDKNGLTITDGSNWTHTFSGKVTGEGDFTISGTGNGTPTFVFTGDLSEWKGAFREENASAGKTVTLNLTGGGNLFANADAGVYMNQSVNGTLSLIIGNADVATTMNGSVINNGIGTLNMTVQGDTVFNGAVTTDKVEILANGKAVFNKEINTSSFIIAAGAKAVLGGQTQTLDSAVTGAGTLEVSSGTQLLTAGNSVSTALALKNGSLLSAVGTVEALGGVTPVADSATVFLAEGANHQLTGNFSTQGALSVVGNGGSLALAGATNTFGGSITVAGNNTLTLSGALAFTNINESDYYATYAYDENCTHIQEKTNGLGSGLVTLSGLFNGSIDTQGVTGTTVNGASASINEAGDVTYTNDKAIYYVMDSVKEPAPKDPTTQRGYGVYSLANGTEVRVDSVIHVGVHDFTGPVANDDANHAKGFYVDAGGVLAIMGDSHEMHGSDILESVQGSGDIYILSPGYKTGTVDTHADTIAFEVDTKTKATGALYLSPYELTGDANTRPQVGVYLRLVDDADISSFSSVHYGYPQSQIIVDGYIGADAKTGAHIKDLSAVGCGSVYLGVNHSANESLVLGGVTTVSGYEHGTGSMQSGNLYIDVNHSDSLITIRHLEGDSNGGYDTGSIVFSSGAMDTYGSVVSDINAVLDIQSFDYKGYVSIFSAKEEDDLHLNITLQGDLNQELKDSQVAIAHADGILGASYGNASFTIKGSGTYILSEGNSMTWSGSSDFWATYNFGVLDANWKGTVQVNNLDASGTDEEVEVYGINPADYGNADSTVDFRGFKGYLNDANLGDADMNVLFDMVLTNTSSMNGFELTNESSGNALVFEGNIRGTGNFVVSMGDAEDDKKNETIYFKGDLSGWAPVEENESTALIVEAGEQTIQFTDKATAINADLLTTGGTMNATISNDAAVTVNGAVSHEKGGILNMTVNTEKGTTFNNTVDINKLVVSSGSVANVAADASVGEVGIQSRFEDKGAAVLQNGMTIEGNSVTGGSAQNAALSFQTDGSVSNASLTDVSLSSLKAAASIELSGIPSIELSGIQADKVYLAGEANFVSLDTQDPFQYVKTIVAYERQYNEVSFSTSSYAGMILDAQMVGDLTLTVTNGIKGWDDATADALTNVTIKLDGFRVEGMEDGQRVDKWFEPLHILLSDPAASVDVELAMTVNQLLDVNSYAYVFYEQQADGLVIRMSNIPEPSTATLSLLALAALAARRRRK